MKGYTSNYFPQSRLVSPRCLSRHMTDYSDTVQPSNRDMNNNEIVDFPGFNVHPLGGRSKKRNPMGNRRRSQGVRGKYAFIKAHYGEFDTAVMCRLLNVSRSGFYQWLRNPLSDRDLEDQRLLGLIRMAYTASHGVYDAPRIFLDLREACETCSKHRVTRIMPTNNIKASTATELPGTPEAPRHSRRLIRCNAILPSHDRTQPGSPTLRTCPGGNAGTIWPS